MNRGFFITGTDTDVGKTWVCAALLNAFNHYGNTIAMKPIACGCHYHKDSLHNDDALLLMQYASVKLAYEQVNPYAFPEPIAPHLAAKHSGQQIDINIVTDIFNKIADKTDTIIVEGVGGWHIPLNEKSTTIDLVQAIRLPVILVAGIRLGCLNHTLLTYESIKRHKVPLAGWIANQIDPDCEYSKENISTLADSIDAPLIGIIPNLGEFNVQTITDCLDISLLESLTGT